MPAVAHHDNVDALRPRLAAGGDHEQVQPTGRRGELAVGVVWLLHLRGCIYVSVALL